MPFSTQLFSLIGHPSPYARLALNLTPPLFCAGCYASRAIPRLGNVFDDAEAEAKAAVSTTPFSVDNLWDHSEESVVK